MGRPRVTPDAIADCRTDLLAFTRAMFRVRSGGEWKDNWHQRIVCDALERVVLGDLTRLIINIPPRSGKTDMAVVNWIAWCMGTFPDAEFIHASYAKRLATTNTYKTRALMTSPEFREVFPWSRLMDDSAAKDEFRTPQGGIVYATGADGTITGYGAGKMRDGFGGAIVVDDPHKAGEALSDVQRANVKDWFEMTMESRKNTPDTPIVVIMQRLHEEDLSGWLLDGGNGEDWHHVKVPARDEAGASFWPDQFPPDMLDRLERASPYTFAGQYMQDPVPRGGAMFKRDWFEVVPAAPAGCRWVRGWDLAATATDDAAFTAGALIGKGPDDLFYIADMRREQLDALGVERLVKNTATQDGRQVRGSIPQDPGAGGKAWAAAILRAVAGHTYEATPETGDKETRAMPLAAQAAAGNVKLVQGDWNKAFLDEATAFPMGRFKDQVDAAARAFNLLTGGSTYSLRGKL